MEILWMLVPAVSVGYLLLKPFIVIVVISFLAINNEKHVKFFRISVLFLVVLAFIYINLHHHKDYPVLFRIVEFAIGAIYYCIYLIILKVMTSKKFKNALSPVENRKD
jgi:peptidoglycan/LPS O-acetylase OafA/YrhL